MGNLYKNFFHGEIFAESLSSYLTMSVSEMLTADYSFNVMIYLNLEIKQLGMFIEKSC